MFRKLSLSIEYRSMLWCCLQISILLLLGDCLNGQPNERQLAADLMVNYDMFSRPVLNPKTQMNIKIQIYLQQVIDVDEFHESVCMKMRMIMHWVDEYMVWDPSNYMNIKHTTRPKSSMWMPKFMPTGKKDTNSMDVSDHLVSYMYNGSAELYQDIITCLHCKIDMLSYPFDENKCVFDFEMERYNLSEVNYGVQIQQDSEEALSLEFDIQDMKVEVREEKSEEVTMSDYIHSLISISVLMKRNPDTVLKLVLMPMLVLGMLSVLGFLLPVEDTAKIDINMSLILTVFVLLTVLEGSLPRSRVMPHIGILMMMVCIICVMSCVFSIIIAKITSLTHQPSNRTMQFCKSLNKCLFCECRSNKINKSSDTLDSEIDEKSGKQDSIEPVQHLKTTTTAINNDSLNQIANCLAEVVEVIHEKKISDDIAEQWYFVATVFNRLFLIGLLMLYMMISFMYFALTMFGEKMAMGMM